jgi:hypothetical protein
VDGNRTECARKRGKRMTAGPRIRADTGLPKSAPSKMEPWHSKA